MRNFNMFCQKLLSWIYGSKIILNQKDAKIRWNMLRHFVIQWTENEKLEIKILSKNLNWNLSFLFGSNWVLQYDVIK